MFPLVLLSILSYNFLDDNGVFLYHLYPEGDLIPLLRNAFQLHSLAISKDLITIQIFRYEFIKTEFCEWILCTRKLSKLCFSHFRDWETRNAQCRNKWDYFAIRKILLQTARQKPYPWAGCWASGTRIFINSHVFLLFYMPSTR